MNLHYPKKQNITDELIRAADGDFLAAEILLNRGYDTPKKIKDFFLKEYVPVGTQDIQDIQIAIDRINLAIKKNEQICVYGDYDVDGVTSTTILVEGLRLLGANPLFHVPDRFSEGYGMNQSVIESLARQNVKLIITCDCGISNKAEIELAASLGMDVIITDHHSIPEKLPAAVVKLNPKLWGKDHKAYHVSGACVSYYLVRALLEEKGMADKANEFVDLVGLSIIADVVELDAENRALLKKGLRQLSEKPRLGIKTLMALAKNYSGIMDEDFIGFQITPRINASGRMDHAQKAVELMLCKEEKTCQQLALELDALNKYRKETEAEIVAAAEEMVIPKIKHQHVLVAYQKDWHHGVIGIAAGRLCEKYHKPVILLSLKEDGKTVVGSARAPEGVSIYEILEKTKKLLTKFGGHTAAAGLSLEISNLNKFITEVEKTALRFDIPTEKDIYIDVESPLKDIREATIESIQKLSPFGQGFPAILFATKGVILKDIRPIKHIGYRMTIAEGNTELSAILWGKLDSDMEGKKTDVVYTLSQVEFQGETEIKLNLVYVNEIKDELLQRKQSASILIHDFRNKQLPLDDVKNELEADHLLIENAPPDLESFNMTISKTKPKELTLVLKYEVENKNAITKKTLGFIKHILEKRAGRTTYEQLCELLNVNFKTVEALLSYLSCLGFIEFEEVLGEIILSKGNSKNSKAAEKYEAILEKLIAEMNAFRRFIQTAPLKDLMR